MFSAALVCITAGVAVSFGAGVLSGDSAWQPDKIKLIETRVKYLFIGTS
jgi:hypothetical protein